MTKLLHTTSYGEPGGVPLVVAHGLFGSGRNWRTLARQWSVKRHVVCVDMRNHGASFWSDRMDYPVMADDLAAVIDALGGSADVLGHSMGGKAAMTLAVTYPERVRTLMVADIAPVTYTHTQLPVIEAMGLLDLASVARRSQAQKALTELTGDAGLGAFLTQSLDFGAQGARWALNLDALAKNMDAIIGFPNGLGQYTGPTFFIRGGSSDYVTRDHATAIGTHFPHVHSKTLEGAGHWLHAEQPAEFVAAIDRFLSRTTGD
ncbi:MAG: alpha/beta fold hydrolase [Pseudomonadota bacterium]